MSQQKKRKKVQIRKLEKKKSIEQVFIYFLYKKKFIVRISTAKIKKLSPFSPSFDGMEWN